MRRALSAAGLALASWLWLTGVVDAHPLGNFSVNQFARLEVGWSQVTVHYVLDLAEIPTFQESQMIDTDGDKVMSATELNAHLARIAPRLRDQLVLRLNGERQTLAAAHAKISAPPGQANLPTLRVECDFVAEIPNAAFARTPIRLRLENLNFAERVGWREIVFVPVAGAVVYDSTAFGSGLSDELKNYPTDLLAAPLDERTAEAEWSPRGGAVPSGARPLRARDGQILAPSFASRGGDGRLTELIAVKEFTPSVAALGLLIAAGLGALHAFSPGHGKTVVGAYLVGSRGTWRHAAFLGLTVTVTHTAGVFGLGVITLFASRYVLPENLFPPLSLISGLIVCGLGLSLFARRLREAIDPREEIAGAVSAREKTAIGALPIAADHAHDEEFISAPLVHSHGGGRAHSHLPPGATGERVTWRSLLALGVSGGLLPCPSALVVLLSAVTLQRIGYGLALVVAFSVGLAATLTGIGLAFVYAGRALKRRAAYDNKLVRAVPVLSAAVIFCVGAAICYNTLATWPGGNRPRTLGAVTDARK